MTILITEREPNRADAERCVIWLLEYYRSQALVDGIGAPAVSVSAASLVALRNELRGAAGVQPLALRL